MALLTLDPETRRRDMRRQGQGIRLLRERAGLTQTDLASKLHMSTDNLRNYESGKQVLTIVHLRPWAEALGVTRAELIEAMGLLNDALPSGWWGRAELEAEGLPAHEIEAIEADVIDRGLKTQQAVVRDAIREWRKRRPRQSNGAASA